MDSPRQRPHWWMTRLSHQSGTTACLPCSVRTPCLRHKQHLHCLARFPGDDLQVLYQQTSHKQSADSQLVSLKM